MTSAHPDDWIDIPNPLGLTESPEAKASEDGEGEEEPDEVDAPQREAHAPASIELPAEEVVSEVFAQTSVHLAPVTTAVAEEEVNVEELQGGASAELEPAAPEPDTPAAQEVVTAPETEWSQTECHMNDIRYAQKSRASVPERKQGKTLKVLVTGQPETGRTTAVKNLFASIAEDPAWQPVCVDGKTLRDFEAAPASFETRILDRTDEAEHLCLTYVIQETPGLTGDAAAAAATLAAYIEAQQARFARQEADVSLARAECADERVDVVLYFLPTNARVSDFDATVIRALAQLVPVLPVMCKADCLELGEVEQRKAEMQRLVAEEGLPLFRFPDAVLARVAPDRRALAAPDAPVAPFRLPFNIVAGNHVDESVHPYWYVRKYRWATCEAFRTADSELKLLRQLLLEDGFWALKDAADALYRKARLAEPAPAPLAATSPVVSTPEPAGARPFVGSPVALSANNPFGSAAQQPSAPFVTLNEHIAQLRGQGSPLGHAASVSAHDVVTMPSGGASSSGSARLTAAPAGYKQVVVKDVAKAPSGVATFRMTLRVLGEERTLCMRIGAAEGSAISNALRSATVSRGCRPSAYDAMSSLLEALDCEMQCVRITACKSTVFYSELQAVNRATGTVCLVDARPSDAINLALRRAAPIYMHGQVIKDFAKPLKEAAL